MIRGRALLLAAVAAFSVSGAKADYYVATPTIAPPNAVLQIIQSGVANGKILPQLSPIDASGNPFATLANPFAIQFGTGVQLPPFSVTPSVKLQDGSGNAIGSAGGSLNVICTSGCSGGGGGGGSVFGPTAVGSAIANPPVVLGGSQNGSAAGLVGVWKVDSSGLGYINCSNCSGGGVSAAFGSAIGSNGTPGGFKDGSGNFQPLLGDVTNGQWVNIKAAISLPVTGTFFQATQPISVASLPLPSGAATQATLASILTALNSPFQAGGSIGNTTFGATQATASALNATVVGTGTFAVQLTGATNNINNIAGTISLPTGAATSALQSTGNSSLATIATNTPALGQALAAGSVPVVLTAAQITTLTPLSTVTVTQGTGTNLHVVCDSGCAGSGGTSATFGATFPTIGTPVGFSQGGNFVAATGTSGNLNVQCANCSGSGVSTADEAAWTAGSSVFVGIGGAYQTTATSNPLTSGQQGFAQLTINRALHINLRNSTGVEIGNSTTPVQVSLANTAANGTALLVTGTAGTFPITAASLPLPTGASTSALQPTNAAQASTTSGQTGGLAMGAVTTGSPAYTTAQTNPLSLTTAGALRVDASATTQPVNGTITSNVGTGTRPISIASAQVASGAFASGSLAAGSIVDLASVLTPLAANTATATKALAIGAQFLTTQPTLTTTQQASLLTTVRGELLVAPGVSGFSVTATQATGTNLHMVCDSGCSGSGGTSSTFATTFPTAGTAAGAEYLSSPPTLTSGQMVALQTTVNGSLHTTVDNTNTNIGNNADAVAAAATSVSPVGNFGFTFNGSTFDRIRSGGTTGGQIVNGGAASGSAVSGNPVLAAGSDGADARTFATDAQGNSKTINGASNTNTIAASQTAQILSATSGGATGATGDYLSHCVVQPATTSPGAVTIADNATTIFSFTGGASSVSNLVPFAIPVGAVSKSAGWKVTTGANVSVACVGRFS